MSEQQVTGKSHLTAGEDHWQIWVDTGGTFTDCLALAPGGELCRCKVLSSGGVRGVVAQRTDSRTLTLDTSWSLPGQFFHGATLRPLDSTEESHRIVGSLNTGGAITLVVDGDSKSGIGTTVEIDPQMEAPIVAAHWVTRTPLLESLPPMTMRLATTRGTNALLEGAGTPTALFITRGFGDLLTIGNQQRDDLFALGVVKRAPLYRAVVEVEERIDTEGHVLRAMNIQALEAAVSRLVEKGITAAAVALLNSYQNPRHEVELQEFLSQMGFLHVSRSADLAPMIKVVPRAETAVVNAYLSGVIGEYLAAVESSVGPGPLHVLTSAGSLVRASSYEPKDSLLSGPAGGVVGSASSAVQSGWKRSLAFDMGGTSTDVSRFDGEFDYRFEAHVGGVRILSPSLAIETVAAGGGSICHYDGRQLKVGPESAGADPGPACYGAGGPLTLTDVNLLLGRLQPQSFEIPIDISAAESAARKALVDLAVDRSGEQERDDHLQGFLDIANERMAEAIRRISIRQGYRPGDFALVAFGGAGGQHACALAEILGMETVLVPADAGLLSAVGLGKARIERIAEQQILQPLEDLRDQLTEIFERLERQAVAAVREEAVRPDQIEVTQRLVFLRLAGQEAGLQVIYSGQTSLREAFSATYEDHFGYLPEAGRIEIESARVFASSKQTAAETSQDRPDIRTKEVGQLQRALVNGKWHQVPVFLRQELRPGDRFSGPALVFENHCATLLHRDWTGEMDSHACLVLRRVGSGERAVG